jgi:hypothetical protein
VESQPLYRVRNWDLHHENNRSRGITRTQWVPVPNDLSGDGYVDLVTHDDGAAHLGVWIGLLMVASRANPRGCLVREDGRPHTAESLARVTRLPEDFIRVAIERLLTIGLLEIVVNNAPSPENGPSAAKPQDGAGESHSAAANPQRDAPKPPDGAAEENGREHHHQERKRKGKEQQRKEPDGTERADEHSKTEHSDARSADGSDFSQKGDDEAENPKNRYASPEDELKAIYQMKAGEPITLAVLDAIRVNLEWTHVSMDDFLVEVKKHVKNEWRNPAGFLRDRSQHFRAKTRLAGAPMTAAEAEEKNYRCQFCGSRVRGEGAILDDNSKMAPCRCASPEYIARQRERGVFAGESPQ